jgi:hypothetical protein
MCRSTAADQNRPTTTVVVLVPMSFTPSGGLDLRGRPSRRLGGGISTTTTGYPGRRAATTEASALLLGSTVPATRSTSAALKVFDEISI